MTPFLRRLRVLIAVVSACVVGSLPACGTMGGGGMRYLVDHSQVQDFAGA
jgi:hypothetical protein